MPKKKVQLTKEDSAVAKYSQSLADVKKTTEKLVKPEPTREVILRSTIEKPVKQDPILETVTKASKKKPSKRAKKKPPKRAKKTVTKEIKHIPPKILLKKNGYELVITEKPQAATKIAAALGDTTKRTFKGVNYYEVDRKGKKLIVACAVGHLFTLTQTTPGTTVPTFEIDWVPNFKVRKKDFTKKYYDVLLDLAKNAGSLTVATDYDIEGEVIGTNVVRLIANQPDANRMKFSTLTTKELNDAYDNKSPTIDWGQAIAGESRHFLDWFYGINLSRELMNAIKTTGRFKIMSIGRVQGPALKLIVDKEKEIKKFKPEPYWQVFVTLEKPNISLKHPKDLFNKEDLEKFKDLEGKKGKASTKKSQQTLPPNPPFNLTTLQTECYKLFGLNPSNTLRVAQSLYLGGLISYPRTSSQKLPDSIDYKTILETLKKEYKVAKLIKKDKPIEGKKTDPAHPSIHPTGNKQILSGDEQKVYDLIVKRFLSLFCENALVDKKRILVKANNLDFSINGAEITKKAWLDIYPTKIKEQDLPDVEGEVDIKSSRTEEKETQPPKRFSPASILSELEKRNLGTKATRASILETLYDRGYIREKSIEATPLGLSLINTLEKYSPIIIDEKLTKTLQDEMDEIVESKDKNLKKKEDKILDKAKAAIVQITDDMKKHEPEIGKALMGAQDKQREIEKKENTLHPCPKCGKGDLAITYSPKNRKFFIACNAYPECKNTHPLPPYGTIKKTNKTCEECNYPLLMSLQKGKRPWIFCFNPECPTNKERVEAYRKKQAEKEGKN
jgi:DNA topoisomerase I